MGHFSGRIPRKMPLRKVPRPWGRGWGNSEYAIALEQSPGRLHTHPNEPTSLTIPGKKGEKNNSSRFSRANAREKRLLKSSPPLGAGLGVGEIRVCIALEQSPILLTVSHALL